MTKLSFSQWLVEFTTEPDESWKERPYQGCPNYYTWSMCVHLENDRICYERCRGKTPQEIEQFSRQYEVNGIDHVDWDKVDWKFVADSINEE